MSEELERLRELYGPGKSRHAAIEFLLEEISRRDAGPSRLAALPGEPAMSAEEKARGILDRLGIEETFAAGDLLELGNLIAAESGLRRHLRRVLEKLPPGAEPEARRVLEWAERYVASRDA